jgi:hypothetical protein
MKVTKGQGTVLVVFVGFLGAFVPSFTAYAQIGVLPDLFEQRTDDLPALARTESRAETTAQQFIPLAGKYSSAQAAEDLLDVVQTGSPAGNCLGTQITNRFVPVRGDPDTPGAEEFRNSDSLAADLIECAGKQTGRNLQEMYIQDLVYSRCRVDMSSIETSTDVSEAEVTIETENDKGLVVAECIDRGIETRYETDTSQVSIKAPPNSFTALAQAAQTINVEMEQVVHQIENNDNHYGTVTGSAACRDRTRANRESKAEDDSLDNADEKLDAIETAVVKQGHGIGSGGDRGAKHIFNEETGRTGFDLLDAVVDSLAERLDGKKFQGDVDGETEVKSNSSTNCGCTRFSCSQSGFSYSLSNDPAGGCVPDSTGSCVADTRPDPNCGTGFNRDGNGNCNFDGSKPSPSCSGDFTRNGGSCTYSGSSPSPCPRGYSYSDGTCNKASLRPGPPTTSPSCDGDFTFDSGSCEYTGSVPSPTCSSKNGVGFEHDGSGGCEFSDSGDPPDPSCPTEDGISFDHDNRGNCFATNPPSPTCEDDCFSGSATANYTADDISADIEILNDETLIPTEAGWRNLRIEWDYERVFKDPP